MEFTAHVIVVVVFLLSITPVCTKDSQTTVTLNSDAQQSALEKEMDKKDLDPDNPQVTINNDAEKGMDKRDLDPENPQVTINNDAERGMDKKDLDPENPQVINNDAEQITLEGGIKEGKDVLTGTEDVVEDENEKRVIALASYRRGMCNGGVCDPDRYAELTQALCGYNVMIGEPYTIIDTASTDPGIRNQIFLPATQTKDATGRMSLNGITARDHLSCKITKDIEIITTVEQFRRLTVTSSSLGSGIGFDNSFEVKVKDPTGTVEASKEVKMSAKVAFSNSKSTKKVKSFLEKTKGAIAMVSAKCTTLSVRLQIFAPPPFTPGFSNAIKELARASTLTEDEQKRYFSMFIEEFGTHYMTSVEMGGEVMDTEFIKQRGRQDFSQNALKQCAKSSSSVNYIFVSSSKQSSGCSAKDVKKFRSTETYTSKRTIITRGAAPPKEGEKFSDWAAKEFKPEPLRMQLKPIVDLLSDRILKLQGLIGQNGTINGIFATEMRKWVIPMYNRFCETMKIDCTVRRGCGFADTCKTHQLCVTENKALGTYKCIETCTRNDIDFNGNDLWAYTNVESWEECAKMCRSLHGNCHGWTYVTDSFKQRPHIRKKCYTKTHRYWKRRQHLKGVISGLQNCGARCQGRDCCSLLKQCDAGEGHCNRHMDCKPGLWCGKGNCPWGRGENCCYKPGRCTGEDNWCCMWFRQCWLGEGDCDTSAQCWGPTVCGNSNCPWGGSDDCCKQP